MLQPFDVLLPLLVAELRQLSNGKSRLRLVLFWALWRFVLEVKPTFPIPNHFRFAAKISLNDLFSLQNHVY